MVASWGNPQKRQDILLDSLPFLPSNVVLHFYGHVPEDYKLPEIDERYKRSSAFMVLTTICKMFSTPRICRFLQPIMRAYPVLH